ncbi:MAG: PspC domain-containing protein [Ardenticatenaceae bacterium]|nr:PspC domain-containing protein [Ardenticatenaceae bacterium]
MSKKMMRSTNDKMVAGVAGGVAEYVQIDPVIVRLLFALAILSNPPLGLLVYVLMAIIMPRDEEVEGMMNPFTEDEIVVKDS